MKCVGGTIRLYKYDSVDNATLQVCKSTRFLERGIKINIKDMLEHLSNATRKELLGQKAT